MNPLNEREIHDYRQMMVDRVRMRAYADAIGRVCPGKTVCEIGVGLGPLSLMALQAGAERVYGIEILPASLEMATRVVRRAGFDESRFVALLGASHEIDLPERVDVLLSETLDSIGVGENTLFFMQDARERFLEPDGIILPSRLTGYLALAAPRGFEAECRFWGSELTEEFGLDYRSILDRVRVNNRTLRFEEDELLGPWTTWMTVDFSRPEDRKPRRNLLEVSRDAEVTGVAMAFEVELCPGVTLRTLPEDEPTHWEQGFSPFRQPVACEAGDALWLEVILPNESTPQIPITTRHIHVPRDRRGEFEQTLRES